MEFWLSRSLLMNFYFSRRNFGYQGAFHTNIFIHNGILAIAKPFHEFRFHTMEFWLSWSLFTNFSFTKEFWLSRSLPHELFCTRWNSGYHEAFSRISFSHNGILAIMKPFHEFLFRVMEFTKCTIWGKILFIYITKSIYIGSASLKILPLYLEPPL
jgi:hypothetical protein